MGHVNDNFIQKNAVKYCNRCRHRTPNTATCKAFPDGIPYEVLVGDVDHKTRIPGDRGVVFEPIRANQQKRR